MSIGRKALLWYGWLVADDACDIVDRFYEDYGPEYVDLVERYTADVDEFTRDKCLIGVKCDALGDGEFHTIEELGAPPDWDAEAMAALYKRITGKPAPEPSHLFGLRVY